MYETRYAKPVHWAEPWEIMAGESMAIRRGSPFDLLVREAYFHERMTGVSQPVHEAFGGKPVCWNGWK